MFKRTLFCTAAMIALNATAPVNAQHANPSSFLDTPELNWMIDGPVDFTAAIPEKRAGLAEFEEGALGHQLLTSITTWLSSTFDLPRIYDHPRVEKQPIVAALDLYTDMRETTPVVGSYDDAVRTVYVPNEWTGGTHEQQSVLVHQMVYHLQNLGEMTYGCPQERAKLAYVAQERWLGLSGQNLEASFKVDPATFLYSTECYIP